MIIFFEDKIIDSLVTPIAIAYSDAEKPALLKTLVNSPHNSFALAHKDADPKQVKEWFDAAIRKYNQAVKIKEELVKPKPDKGENFQ